MFRLDQPYDGSKARPTEFARDTAVAVLDREQKRESFRIALSLYERTTLTVKERVYGHTKMNALLRETPVPTSGLCDRSTRLVPARRPAVFATSAFFFRWLVCVFRPLGRYHSRSKLRHSGARHRICCVRSWSVGNPRTRIHKIAGTRSPTSGPFRCLVDCHVFLEH